AMRVERSINGAAFVEIASLAANTTSYVDATVLPDTSYSYRVRVTSAAGNSAYSAAASLSTGTTPPASVTATANTPTSVQISWTDTSTTETAFHIERSTAGGAFAEIGTVAANVTTYTDATAAESTAY